jgi:hypothetical protein
MKQEVRPKTTETAKSWKPGEPRFDVKHPTSDDMRQLLGSRIVDQHKDRSWTVIMPAGQSTKSVELALQLGDYTLDITERVVFVKPAFDKWFV